MFDLLISFWIISFWIAISPLPLVLSGDSPNSISPLFEKSFKPFHIKPLIEITREFLSSVSENSRILLVNEDPNNNYEEIWGIYKSMNELLFYSANLNSILIFPDFYAIASNNKTFSHGFWGTGINEVNQNLTYWDAKYIIITQYSGTKLDQKWERDGFVKISQLDWGEFYYLLGNEPCWESRFSPPPKYFLLMRNI